MGKTFVYTIAVLFSISRKLCVKKYILLLGLLVTLSISCQDKPKMNEKFEWQETISCPVGYPVDVYRGGLESAQGGFTSLYLGTHSGIEGWGSEGRSMSSGAKTVPNHLHVIWLAYAEDMFYEVDTDIDYEKMVKLFRKGYYTPADDPDYPEPFKENYDCITVGFAPGGVVVVWLSGSGRQVEIGRYKAQGVRIPKEESEDLDYPIKNLFDPEYRKWIMQNKSIVPLEVQKANEGKPIPFGHWDSYRKKYKWNTSFIFPDENEKTRALTYYYYNGEMEILFGNSQTDQFPNIPQELRWDYKAYRAVPSAVKFTWLDKDNARHVGVIEFDEEEVFKVFQEVYKDDPELETELVIRVSMSQDDLSIKLIPKGEDVNAHQGWLSNNKITMRKTKYNY